VSNRTLEERLLAIEDRIAIEDVIASVTMHSDMDEPEAALKLYVPNAPIDYSSQFGAVSHNIPVEEHRRRILDLLPGFDARSHKISNFQIKIDGDSATSRSHVWAVHALGAEAWFAYGTYYHSLVRTAEGWKICYQKAVVVFEENKVLQEQARARVTMQRQAAAQSPAPT
jgi:SnoaL-like domain